MSSLLLTAVASFGLGMLSTLLRYYLERFLFSAVGLVLILAVANAMR